MFSIFVLWFLKIFSSLAVTTMEFKQEELVEREMEIARYLKLGVSMKEISDKTGLSSKHVTAHLNNMRIKLKTKDVKELINLLNATDWD
jgi:DNA-binding CsgD family transcriptional regulator